jgi:hypothetical protein
MKCWLAKAVVGVATIVLFVRLPSPAQAGLIVNGSFENPVVAPGALQILTPGQTIGGAWTVLGNPGTNVLLVQTSHGEPFSNLSQFNAHEGLNSLDLTGDANVGPSAGIQQAISTVAGEEYTLSFFVGRATPSGGPGTFYPTPATVDLSIDSGTRVSFTNSDITDDGVNWRQFSFTFTSVGSTTTITFYNGTAAGNNFAGLDDVSLVSAAVPEPSGLALLITGAVGMGTFIWRRQRVRSVLT